MIEIHKPEVGRVHEITAIIDYDRPLAAALKAGRCNEVEGHELDAASEINHPALAKILPTETRHGRWKCRILLVNFGEKRITRIFLRNWRTRNDLEDGDMRAALHMAEHEPNFNEVVNMYTTSVQLPQTFDFQLKKWPNVCHYLWVGYVGEKPQGTHFWATDADDGKVISMSEAVWYLFFDPTECTSVPPDYKLPE